MPEHVYIEDSIIADVPDDTWGRATAQGMRGILGSFVTDRTLGDTSRMSLLELAALVETPKLTEPEQSLLAETYPELLADLL